MPNSKHIAGLLGPTLVAMLESEFPLVPPHLYAAQIPPVVYLSGVLMFVGGLAIVRAHNHWTRDWTVLVTLSGWFFLALGLFRMCAASQYQQWLYGRMAHERGDYAKAAEGLAARDPREQR